MPQYGLSVVIQRRDHNDHSHPIKWLGYGTLSEMDLPSETLVKLIKIISGAEDFSEQLQLKEAVALGDYISIEMQCDDASRVCYLAPGKLPDYLKPYYFEPPRYSPPGQGHVPARQTSPEIPRM